MDNFVCVISNSVLIYNFHFVFPIVVCPNTKNICRCRGSPVGFPGSGIGLVYRSEMRDCHYKRHMRIGNFEGRH